MSSRPTTGFLTWIVRGLCGLRQVLNFVPNYYFLIGTPPGQPATEYRLQGTNPNSAVAGFGQLSFQLTSGLQLQIGGRYTDAKTTNHVQVLQYGLPLADEQSQKYTNTSGKVSLNWTVNPNNFLYAFVSTGFRPGGLNVPVGLGTPAAFDSEKLTDYEIGWKNRAFDGHLRTQIDGFYDDLQEFPGHRRLSAISDLRLRAEQSEPDPYLRFRGANSGGVRPVLAGRWIGRHAQLARPVFCHRSAHRDGYALRSAGGSHERVVHRPDRTLANLCAQLHLQHRRSSTRFVLSDARLADAAPELRLRRAAVGDACSRIRRWETIWRGATSLARNWPGSMRTSSRRCTAPTSPTSTMSGR